MKLLRQFILATVLILACAVVRAEPSGENEQSTFSEAERAYKQMIEQRLREARARIEKQRAPIRAVSLSMAGTDTAEGILTRLYDRHRQEAPDAKPRFYYTGGGNAVGVRELKEGYVDAIAVRHWGRGVPDEQWKEWQLREGDFDILPLTRSALVFIGGHKVSGTFYITRLQSLGAASPPLVRTCVFVHYIILRN